ncbi:uncharacterized protein LOC114337611 isoform X3 [Diabrotica virgifera virgifera]|uniref:Uncharacterized protein LOC114346436 n=1 Tax=Diabrotica virgifera virgifera TaxID=50390 RepID=A0A6P7GTZ5_DIAVI|nr:uncharacterized protein LOC114337611 isoform X3 [Diabrotica virgifera virgifera]
MNKGVIFNMKLTLITWSVVVPIICGAQSPNSITEECKETLYTSKPTVYEKYLDMPKIKWRCQNSCGPSIGEVFLRYFGLTSLHFNDEDIQMALLPLMYKTSAYRLRLRIVDIVNKIIKDRNLTNGKLYSEAYVENRRQIPGRLATIYREMYYLISRSLEHDMPVALSIDNGFNCMVVQGFQYGGSFDTVNYTYVDPRTGNSKTESVEKLMGQTAKTIGDIYLMVYNPPLTDDETDFTACSELLNISNSIITMEPFAHLNHSKPNGICPPGLNYHHVITQGEDFFVLNHTDFNPDEIKVGLSLKTALGIEKIYFEVSDTEFKKYLRTLFKTVRQTTGTGLFGSIQKQDHDVMVDYMFEHYAYFHFAIRRLAKDKRLNLLEVATNRNRVFDPAKIKAIYKC